MAEATDVESPDVDVIFYISDARVGVVRPDGTGERYPEFRAPNQVYWQLAHVFPDGRQAVLWSQEPPENPDASFSEPDRLAFARTHLWLHDLVTGDMREIGLPSYASVIGLLPGGEQWLIIENTDNVASAYAADLNGAKGETCFSSPGYAYGATLSPEGDRVALHIAGAPGAQSYQIYVIDLDSHDRTLIAGDPQWLYFAPTWSPDGQWLLYQRCAYQEDPWHDRSDLCLSRPDGSEHRMLTDGQQHWFAAAQGTPDRHSSGSNCPAWSPDGRWIACTLLLPDSQTAWPYRVGQPDTDHFNRDYRPDLARGGTRVCLIDPETGTITPTTHDDPPTWHVRPAWSPDSSQLVVARADVGGQPELWVVGIEGGRSRLLTRGVDGRGADHARWRQLTAGAAANLQEVKGTS